MEVNNTVKQVIIIRKDLKNTQGHKVRTGKVIAQACHACESWIFNSMDFISLNSIHSGTIVFKNEVKDWIEQGHKKIALQISGEEELVERYNQAKEAGLMAHIVVDAGLTEFGGVETKTALAIGPGRADEIDKITGDLKPY